MPTWATALLIASGTSLVTTVLLALTVQARLEARNRRIQGAFSARERFADAVFTILINCGRLEATPIPDEASEVVKARLTEERKRWIEGINDATQHLIDSIGPLTWPNPIRTIVVQYAGTTRAVWLSERPETKKLTLLAEGAGAVQNLLFTASWRRPRRIKNARHLQQLMDDLEANER